jgi:hypothetical protein
MADEYVEDMPGMLIDDEDIETMVEPDPIDEDDIAAFEELIGFTLDIDPEDDMAMDTDVVDDIVLRPGLAPGLFPPMGVAVAV